jgi:hypothetical protein
MSVDEVVCSLFPLAALCPVLELTASTKFLLLRLTAFGSLRRCAMFSFSLFQCFTIGLKVRPCGARERLAWPISS